MEKLEKKRIREIKNEISDREFLTSPNMIRRLNQTTRNMLSGERFHLTVIWGRSVTAMTDGENILVNANNKLTRTLPSKKLKALSLVGMTAHEVGHIMYTDFEDAKKFSTAVEEGRFYPMRPLVDAADWHNLNDMEDALKNNIVARKVIVMFAHDLDNILEDKWMETILCTKFPGIIRTGVQLNEFRMSETDPSLATMMKHTDDKLAIIISLVLQQARYGRINNWENISNEYTDCINELAQIIQDALYEDEHSMRMDAVNKVLVHIWPWIKEAILEAEEQAKNQKGKGQNGQQGQPSKSGQGSGQGSCQGTNQGSEQGSGQSGQSGQSNGQQGQQSGANASGQQSQGNQSSGQQSSQGSGQQASSGQQTSQDHGTQGQGSQNTGANGQQPQGNAGNGMSQGEDEGSESTANSAGSETSDESGEESAKAAGTGSEQEAEAGEENASSDEADGDSKEGSKPEDESGDDSKSKADEALAAKDELTDEDKEFLDALKKLKNRFAPESQKPVNVNTTPQDANCPVENRKEFQRASDEIIQRTTGGRFTTEGRVAAFLDALSESKEDAKEVDGFNDDLMNSLNEMAKDALIREDEGRLATQMETALTSADLTRLHAVKRVYTRLRNVPESYKNAYKELEPEIKKTSTALQRKLADLLQEQEGSEEDGLFIGKTLTKGSLYRQDRRIMSKTNLPDDNISLAVGIVVDMSGSMASDHRIDAAKMASLVVYDFCQAMGIPVMIYGHRATGDAVELQSFAEFDSVDKQDRFRLMGIAPGGCNRDGLGYRFVGEQLAKREEENKLLIMISDGQPNDYGYGGEVARDDLKDAKLSLKKRGVATFAAAIGDDRDIIRNIYGDGFLNISNLNRLPVQMLKLIERYMK